MQPTYLSYDRGTLLVRSEAKVPYSTWDDRVRAFRAQALYYREIVAFLEKSELGEVKDGVEDLPPCPELRFKGKLRAYQRKALDSWDRAGRRGVIVLPTGAGKTVIGMKAIELVNRPAVVVVPTLDLLEQWRRRVAEDLGVEVGVYGGGENTLKAVTVCTYDSAFLRAGELGNRFSLIIFDEAHHLPAESFRLIAEMFTAPYRMGLTATYERDDMLHLELPRLIGGVVYRLDPEDLAGRYLSDYTVERVNVELTEREKEEYQRNYRQFTGYLGKNRIWMRTPMDFQRFIMRTARDPDARRALLARNRAVKVAFDSEAKLDRLEEILRENPDERVLVFTQHNDLVCLSSQIEVLLEVDSYFPFRSNSITCSHSGWILSMRRCLVVMVWLRVPGDALHSFLSNPNLHDAGIMTAWGVEKVPDRRFDAAYLEPKSRNDSMGELFARGRLEAVSLPRGEPPPELHGLVPEHDDRRGSNRGEGGEEHGRRERLVKEEGKEQRQEQGEEEQLWDDGDPYLRVSLKNLRRGVSGCPVLPLGGLFRVSRLNQAT